MVEVITEDAAVGIRMELRVQPDQNRSQFSTLLVRAEQPVVWLEETEAPLPNPGLELRASGLWMEFIAQDPLHHFTADLEAFALELDDPADAVGTGYGRRVPVACELEWQTRADPEPIVGGYRVPCFVLGDFQVGHETLEIDGWGWRSHTWGENVPVDPFRGRVHGELSPESFELDPALGLVVGWGHGLDGEVHRVVETTTGLAWTSPGL